MQKKIGFDRNVKKEWLDRCVEQLIAEADIKEIRESVLELISLTISNGDNQNKALANIMSAWVKTDEAIEDSKQDALKIFHNIKESEKLALHYCMLMYAYPIFKDYLKAAAKIYSIENVINVAYIRERIYELWGERSTIKYAINRITNTLIDFNIIESAGKTGMYQLVAQYPIEHINVKEIMLEMYLKSIDRLYIPYIEIPYILEFFCFDFDVTLGEISQMNRIKTNTIGGEVVVTL